MKNITLKQFAALADASPYEILASQKPVNLFAGKTMSINQMPYANVKYCFKLLQKATSWDVIRHMFEICFDVTADEFWQAGVIEFYQANRFILHEFERVVNTENKVMASQNTDSHLWIMAGADRLKPYSDTLPLLNLGKVLGMYPFDLGRKPYGEVFSLLAQSKVQSEVEQDFYKLKHK